MKIAKVVALLSGVGLVVTLLLPTFTNGRASVSEVAPFIGPLVILFVLSGIAAIRGGKKA
jgi:hypothetical protein